MFSKFMYGNLNYDINEIYNSAFKKYIHLPMRERDIECIRQCMVFSWQQQSTDFNETINYIPRIKSIFDSTFVKFDTTKKYYRGIHLDCNRVIEDYDINQFEYVAATTDYSIAEEFAVGTLVNVVNVNTAHYRKQQGMNCYILEIEGDLMLDVQKYRDMSQSEYIIKNARITKDTKL